MVDAASLSCSLLFSFVCWRRSVMSFPVVQFGELISLESLLDSVKRYGDRIEGPHQSQC